MRKIKILAVLSLFLLPLLAGCSLINKNNTKEAISDFSNRYLGYLKETAAASDETLESFQALQNDYLDDLKERQEKIVEERIKNLINNLAALPASATRGEIIKEVGEIIKTVKEEEDQLRALDLTNIAAKQKLKDRKEALKGRHDRLIEYQEMLNVIQVSKKKNLTPLIESIIEALKKELKK